MDLKKYNVLDIVGNVLPSSKRVERMIGYCNNLIKSIKTTHNDLFSIYYDTEKELTRQHNQVPIYEKVINEAFGLTYSFGTTNSIYITHDNDSISQLYIYNENESNTAYIYNENESKTTYFRNSTEIVDLVYDYEVNVDSALNLDLLKVKAYCDILNMVDRVYIIKEY